VSRDVPWQGKADFTSERPLILLTDYPPDARGGGAVILRSLLGPREREGLVWLTLSPTNEANENVITLRSGSAGRGGRSVGKDTTIHAGALAREILAVAQERAAGAIWVVMHHAAVPIAAKIVRSGRFPVHLTVHDDPAFANALRSKRYLMLVPWIERHFAYAMKRATSIDVVGEAMRKRYRMRYGVDSTVVHRALDEPVESGPTYDADRHGLRVGVLGSTYSYEPLPLLAKAVEIAAKRLNVPPRLRIMGKSYGERLRDEYAGRVEVDVTGHVSEIDAIPLLRECFALDLNYPFDRRDAVLRQTSFPTKLSTYIQAARPLLLHVPTDSSVMPLVDESGYAVPWTNRDPEAGADALVSMWNRPENHRCRAVAAERIRSTYYDPIRNRATLFASLGGLLR
jgi:hypothetical protein